MKAKKLAALGLSAALSLSLASPAFATSTNKTTKITGTYQEIAIDVVVPTTGTATINPYGLPVKVQSTETTGTKKDLVTISGQKITTMPMAIYSKTEVGLLVGATVTGEIKGENLKLAAAAIPEGATTNTALIYLETKTSKRDEANLAAAASTTKVGPFEAWDPDTANNGASAGPVTAVTGEIANWDSTYNVNARNQILVGTTAKTKNAIGYLTKAADNNGTKELAAGGAMWFRLAGDVVAAPKTAWTKSDGVTVTVAFTFEPTESAGVPGKISGTFTAGNEGTLSLVDIDSTHPQMTFSSDATYQWTVEKTPTDTASGSFSTDAEGNSTDTTASPKITFDTAGDYKIKVVVKENNVPYVAEATITVAA